MIEIGGDVTRPLAGGAIKLVGLATRRKRDDSETYQLRDGLIENNASVIGGFDQHIEARRNETIGRLSWTRSNLAGFSFEVGAEAALNTLDSQVELFAFDQNGARVRINLPLDDATVKEKRGEVYVSLGRNLSPTLRVDGGVNYEFSRLKVRGDALADRTLKFLKPNLSVDWRPGNGWHGQSFGSPNRRPARFLRLHQRRRTFDRPGQCRQREPPAAADLGVSPDRRASAAG